MRSMTGYGRRQVSRDGREMTVEIKTVNHRFLDISCRMPRALSFAEDAVRKQIGAALRRGHVDVNVTYLNLRQDAREVRLDEGLVLQYKEALLNARQIARKETLLHPGRGCGVDRGAAGRGAGHGVRRRPGSGTRFAH